MLGMLVAGVRALREFPASPRSPARWPAVTIVVAARDEAAGIEAAMRSLLALDYPARQFYVFLRPWRAREPRSSAYIGVGAFNLVRASAYRAIGGHERIALRPDDDVKLGKLIKLAGLRQDLRHAPDALCVTWYASVAEFVRGLEKNVLAGLDYRGALGLAGLALLFLLEGLPWILLASADAPTQIAAAAAIVTGMACIAGILRETRAPMAAALLAPAAALVFVYACARSILLTYVRGGIVWRGTF